MNELKDQPKVAIIGAGPGGYTAAIRLTQLGVKPVVIEKEEIGGVCLNWGCIPTKTIYSTTEPLAKMDSWSNRGVEFDEPEISLDRITAHQKRVVEQLTGGVAKLIKSNGGEIISGRAELLPDRTIKVQKPNSEQLHLEPKKVIIATGSSPVELPGFPFDDSRIWDSRTAVFPNFIPEKLLILGAGVIGLEMATIYRRLGSEVQVLEMQDSILPEMNLDRRPASYLSRALKKQGIKISTNAKAIEYADGDKILVEESGEETTYTGDRVLASVGRKPNLSFADPDLDLTVDDRGYVVTGDHCKTDLDGVFAIGDVAGGPLLAHKAAHEAIISASAIVGEDSHHLGVIPSAVFTDPEYAEVGLSLNEARKSDYDPVVGRFPLRASGKAMAMDETDGIIQVVADKKTDTLIGGSIVGPHASDMIAELALGIEAELTLSEIAETIHPHPTLSEAIMEAAENAHGKAIHTGNR